MIAKEFINRQRIKAWIYEGIEIELELCGLNEDNKFLYDEKDLNHEDIDYNNKQIAKLQAKLALANSRIEDLQLNG